MKSLYEVQQLLKKHGVIIYTGDRMGDLDLIEMEIQDLYAASLIILEDYQQSRLLINRERRLVEEGK